MNLARALSEKNRLARTVREIQHRIEAHNSFLSGNTPAYDTEVLLAELMTTIAALTELKVRIHTANREVQEQIFRLAELKSLASFLRQLPIKEGKVLQESWRATEVNEWQAQLSTVARDALLATTETEIDALQTALNRHNFLTEV